MRHLQEFKIFESAEALTQEQRGFLDSQKAISATWWLTPEGKINVDGSFLPYFEGLTDFKGLEFGEVSKNFEVYNNRLTSLKGGPTKVGGDFNCRNNLITSLEGGPEVVEGDYYCSPNANLVSLVGAPRFVGGEFTGPGGVRVPEGVWNPQGIFEVFKKTKNARGKALLGTIMPTHVGREFFQREIDVDPAGALAELKNYFSEPWFRGLDLKWPGKMGPWVDLMGDAGELGF